MCYKKRKGNLFCYREINFVYREENRPGGELSGYPGFVLHHM
jgi:hypothetical protein